jgi:putative MATE family efflux protein
MMAGMVAHMAYMIVDTAFIGQLGRDALAAATFVGPLFFFTIALISGVTMATTALVAQAIGRKDHDEADRVGGSALLVGLLTGLALTGFYLLTGPRILQMFGARGDVASLAWDFFGILGGGMWLFFLSSTLRAVLTGEGNTHTPMAVMTVASLLNVGLDPVFIFWLDMGIAGAAVATLISQVFAFSVFAYLIFFRKKSLVRFHRSNLRFHRPLFQGIWTIGLPTTGGLLVMSAGRAFNNRVLASFGEFAVAAYGAGTKIDMLVTMPILALAAASVSVIGMFAGAQRSDLVRDTALYAYRWALTLSVTVGVTAFLASGWVLRVFTDDAEVISTGRTYLGFMVLAYPMMAFGMTSGRILQGLGYGLPALVITSFRVLGVAVPIAYISVFAFDAPIEAVWISLVVGGLSSNVMAFFWIRSIVWKRDPTLRASKKAGRPEAERTADDLSREGPDGGYSPPSDPDAQPVGPSS